MIPRGRAALTDLAMKLAMSVAPETSSVFAVSNVGMVAMVMQCLAEEYDRAAETRMRDVAELKALFAGANVEDAALRADLDAFASAEPASLTLPRSSRLSSAS